MIKNLMRCGAIALSCIAICACSSDESQEQESAPEVDDSAILGVSNDIENAGISYCYHRYMGAAETRKILEVFTGDEYTYGRLTLRTQPKKRAGMYFFVMFGWEPDDIALGCKIELSIDSSDTPHPRTFTFTVPETHSVLREIRLGVTGKDWPDSQAVVNAWKIVVKSPSGKVITEKQSWLWGLDAKK